MPFKSSNEFAHPIMYNLYNVQNNYDIDIIGNTILFDYSKTCLNRFMALFIKDNINVKWLPNYMNYLFISDNHTETIKENYYGANRITPFGDPLVEFKNLRKK